VSARVGASAGDGGPVECVSARVGAGSDATTSTGVPVGFDAEAFSMVEVRDVERG